MAVRKGVRKCACERLGSFELGLQTYLSFLWKHMCDQSHEAVKHEECLSNQDACGVRRNRTST